MIPFFGLPRQYQNLREEILHITNEVYSSGKVLDGVYSQNFERRIAQRCGVSHAIAVNSGTQALIFAQQALFPESSKILIPAISFVATLNSVLMAGNVPKFCDVTESGLLALESLDYALDGAGIGGVMYVNLYGNIVDYDKISVISNFFNKEIKIIEDAAQSLGGSYRGRPSGSLGDISILSFDPTKNLPNYGSGGMVLTDDPELAALIMNFRDNGKLTGHEIPGTNSKMSESDCAQMCVKLGHFDAWQERRAKIANYYNQELHYTAPFGTAPLHVESDVQHAWHKYVIRSMYRSELQQHLKDKNIETKVHYELPLHEHSVGWNYVNYAHEIYREAGAFTAECLSLPIYPELTDNEVQHVVDAIKLFHRRRKHLTKAVP